MPAQGQRPPEADVQAVHDRYLREVVEDLGLCPFARRCREQGRVARPLLYAPTSADEAARALATLSAAQPDVEVALLTFVLPEDHPWRSVDEFEAVVKAVRDAYGERTPRYYMVGFHPDLRGPQDPRRAATPDGLVPWLRRTPDPVIQCIRADLLDRLRREAQVAADARFMAEMTRLGLQHFAAQAINADPELSADIARHNFASVGAGEGRAALERKIAEILAARRAL
jgi:hypothetical protein